MAPTGPGRSAINLIIGGSGVQHTKRGFWRALDLLLAEDMDGFADLWAEDGTMEFPFAAAGAPTRLEGREAVRQYMADYPQMARIKEYPYVTVHQTPDPETIVSELGARGIAACTGEPYEMRYVQVITVRQGRIVSFRDYWSPVMVARAMGDLSALEEQAHEQARERGRG
jgi:uncharacterized protein